MLFRTAKFSISTFNDSNFSEDTNLNNCFEDSFKASSGKKVLTNKDIKRCIKTYFYYDPSKNHFNEQVMKIVNRKLCDYFKKNRETKPFAYSTIDSYELVGQGSMKQSKSIIPSKSSRKKEEQLTVYHELTWKYDNSRFQDLNLRNEISRSAFVAIYVDDRTDNLIDQTRFSVDYSNYNLVDFKII